MFTVSLALVLAMVIIPVRSGAPMARMQDKLVKAGPELFLLGYMAVAGLPWSYIAAIAFVVWRVDLIAELLTGVKQNSPMLAASEPPAELTEAAEVREADSVLNPGAVPSAGAVPAAKLVGSIGTCQVCGQDMVSNVVRCSGCETPHHKDCFQYAGLCSIFACGSVKFK